MGELTNKKAILCSECFDRDFLGCNFYLHPRSTCSSCGRMCLGYQPSELPTCPCCESNVEKESQIYECPDCDFRGCGLCLTFHQQIAGHYGDSASSDTEISGYQFAEIRRGIA